MASKQGTVDFILEQIAAAGTVSAKKMFGEYALYCDGKMVALVCDDQLFVKITEAGKASWAHHAPNSHPTPRPSHGCLSPAKTGMKANG
jgi:TfoX/Sxy family transcriptional regulator of competence genes